MAITDPFAQKPVATRPKIADPFAAAAPRAVRPVAPSAPAPTDTAKSVERDWGETAKDAGIGLLQGATNLVGGAAALGEAANPVTSIQRGLAQLGVAPPPRTPVADSVVRLNDALNNAASPAIQAERQDLANVEGFVPTVKHLATRPRLLGQFAVEQIPNVATLGTGAALRGAGAARAAGEAAFSAAAKTGATEAAAAAAAREAGTEASRAAAARFIAAANAPIEGGSALVQAQTEAMNLPDEVWQASENYQELVAGGMSADDAKRTLAQDAGARAALVGAAAGYLGGKISAPFEADVFTRNIPGGVAALATRPGATRAAAGVAREAGEEAVQEGGSQIGTNYGVQAIDETRGLMEGVPEAAATGATLGAVLGGGMAAGGALTARKPFPNAQPGTLQDAANAAPPAEPTSAGQSAAAPAPQTDGTLQAAVQATRPTLPRPQEVIDRLNASPTPAADDNPFADANEPVQRAGSTDGQDRMEFREQYDPLQRAIKDAQRSGDKRALAKALNDMRAFKYSGVTTPEAALLQAAAIEKRQNELPEQVRDRGELMDAAYLRRRAQELRGAGGSPADAPATQTTNVVPPTWINSDTGEVGQPTPKTVRETVQAQLRAQHAAGRSLRINAAELADAWGLTPKTIVQAHSAILREGFDPAVVDKEPKPAKTPKEQSRGKGQEPGGSADAGQPGTIRDVQPGVPGAGAASVPSDIGGTAADPRGTATGDSPGRASESRGDLDAGATEPGDRGQPAVTGAPLTTGSGVRADDGAGAAGEGGAARAADVGRVAAPVTAAASEAATSPTNDLPDATPAQREAGNFRVGRAKINGLDISIEYPRGVKRKEHHDPLAHHYGYVRRTEGADGEKVDVFLTDRADDTSLPVFVVDQTRQDGTFDEHKAVLGAATEDEARAAYLANYPAGWNGAGAITQMTQEQFKQWVRDPEATKRPAGNLAAPVNQEVEGGRTAGEEPAAGARPGADGDSSVGRGAGMAGPADSGVVGQPAVPDAEQGEPSAQPVPAGRRASGNRIREPELPVAGGVAGGRVRAEPGAGGRRGTAAPVDEPGAVDVAVRDDGRGAAGAESRAPGNDRPVRRAAAVREIRNAGLTAAAAKAAVAEIPSGILRSDLVPRAALDEAIARAQSNQSQPPAAPAMVEQAQDDAGAAAGADRRTDAGTRAAVDALPADERDSEIVRLRQQVATLEREVRTSQITGLPNKAAFEADESLGWKGVAAIDMDGLGRLNEFVGHEGADKILRAVGEALSERAGDEVRFYHRSGDEFAARFKNKNIARGVMLDIQQELADTSITITGVDQDGNAGTWVYDGIGITFGTGADYETADAAATRSKAERQASGQRQPKTELGAPRQLRAAAAAADQPAGDGEPAGEVETPLARGQRVAAANKNWTDGLLAMIEPQGRRDFPDATQVLAILRAAAKGLAPAARRKFNTRVKEVFTSNERTGTTAANTEKFYLLSEVFAGADYLVDDALAAASDAPTIRASQPDDDYRGEHVAPGRDSGAPANDLTGGGDFYPDDVYSPQAVQYYGTGDDRLDREAFTITRALKGRPNATVKVYRAVPVQKTTAELIAAAEKRLAQIQRRGSSDKWEYDRLSKERDRLAALPAEPKAPAIQINPGDWVSITRGYAKDHGESALRGQYKIISKTVKASDIFTNGDSIQEWGYDPPRSTTAASQPETAGKGITAPVLRQSVARWTAGWGDAQPRIQVLNRPVDLPDFVKNSDVGWQTAEAIYDGKTVYMVASNLVGEARALQVLAHEAIGHHGLAKIMDSHLKGGWAKFENDVERLRKDRSLGSEAMRAALDEVERRYPNASKSVFANELPAVMVEKGIRNGLMDRVVAAVRQFLRSIGMDNALTKVGEADIRQLLVRGERALRAGAAAAPRAAPVMASRPYENAPDSLMGFRRNGPQKSFGEQNYQFFLPLRVTLDGDSWIDGMDGLNRAHALERAHRNWVGATFEEITRAEFDADQIRASQPDVQDDARAVVDGLSPAERDSDMVQAIASDLWDKAGTESPFFQSWFNSSAVKDPDGTPKVVFHGTGEDFDAFDSSRLGGSTAHMTAPLGFFFAESRASAEAYAENASRGVPADQRVIGAYLSIRKPYAMKAAEFMAIESQDEARALQAKLRANGHDGIHLPDFKQWIAFEPTQIKATDNRGTFDPSRPSILMSNPDQAIGQISALMGGTKSSATLLERLRGKVEDWRPAWLGALTLRHLADLTRGYLPQIGMYSDLVQQIATDRNVMQEEGGAQADKWRKWASKNKAAQKALTDLMHDATIASTDPAEDFKPLTFDFGGQKGIVPDRKTVKEAVAALRMQMLGRGRDAKKPMMDEAKRIKGLIQRNVVRRRQHAELLARFNALPPAAQQMYREVRDMYAKRDQQREAALVNRIKDMKLDGQREASAIASIRAMFETKRVEAPYFPLQRNGDYWIAATTPPTADDPVGQPTFIMRESHKEWQREIRELREAGFKINGFGRKTEGLREVDGASAKFVTEAIQLLDKAGAPDSAKDEIYQLYLQSLPDLSQRKHRIHRKKTAGFSDDALRAFGTNMLHEAHQIARMRYSHQLTGLVDLMGETLDAQRTNDTMKPGDIAAADAALGELKKRHAWIMNPQDSKLTNAISSLGFVYYLGVTPAAALVNMTQPAIIAFPALAAKYGNSVKAMNYLLSGMRDSLRTGGNLQRTLTKQDERDAYAAMDRMGLFQKTQAHNLAGIAEGESARYSPVWAKTMEGISLLFHKAEVVNREATALAAYRLARQAGRDHQTAIREANDLTQDTMFDYSNANRARFMQSNTAKVLLMFRQYSLNMTWFLARNAYQTFKGESPEVRQVARRTLTGVLGMTALFAGALGLPVIGMVFSLLNAAAATFGDDDEPYDAETEFRNFLTDMLGAQAAHVITEGPVNALTGADIGSRVSLNGLWFRDADRQLEGRDAYYNLLEQAAGPVGGIVKNVLVGKKLFDEGHLWRGVETMMPKALKDGMKGLRYVDEGPTNLRGDPLVADLNAYQTMLQLGGFSPTAVSQQYDVNRAAKNFEQHILDRRARLLDSYAMAFRLGDAEGKKAVLEKIRAFNQKNREIAITGQTIERSIKDRMRYSAKAENGIVLNPKLAARAQQQIRFADGGGAE